MNPDTRQLGNKGEQQAADYLVKQGYNMLARNYKSKTGEIDIIAGEKGYIVFVEVKMRNDLSFGSGAEAIDRTKQRKIAQTAMFYIKQNRLEKRDFRFDLITVENDVIKHDKNIFFVEGCTI